MGAETCTKAIMDIDSSICCSASLPSSTRAEMPQRAETARDVPHHARILDAYGTAFLVRFASFAQYAKAVKLHSFQAVAIRVSTRIDLRQRQ